MQAVKRILVVIDPSQEEQVALNRASLIAGFIECELHLLVCENREDYSDLLARLRVEQDAKGIRCSVTQDWHHNATDTICRAVAREGCDLVIKQVARTTHCAKHCSHLMTGNCCATARRRC